MKTFPAPLCDAVKLCRDHPIHRLPHGTEEQRSLERITGSHLYLLLSLLPLAVSHLNRHTDGQLREVKRENDLPNHKPSQLRSRTKWLSAPHALFWIMLPFYQYTNNNLQYSGLSSQYLSSPIFFLINTKSILCSEGLMFIHYGSHDEVVSSDFS